MNGYRIIALLCAFAWASPVASSTLGQEKTSQVILEDLNNPCGVAIQPGTGMVFVSDSGNGRVFKISEKKPVDVIVDFPVNPFELDGSLKFGPLGVIFRGRDTLIVGGGGEKDGEDAIMAFDLTKLGAVPLTPEDAEFNLTLPADSENPAEGNYFSFDLTRTRMFVTCGGVGDKGWIAVADLADDGISNLRRQIPSSELARVAGPGGLTISPEGHVVVTQMGSRDTPGDSVLAFYSPAGELLDKFPTGLNDIVALKYGPRKRRLFALDFSWADPKQGGLYQLIAVDSQNGCKAKLITSLQRPTAMAFDRNGDLYVTICGVDKAVPDDLQGEDELLPDPGKLVLIKDVD